MVLTVLAAACVRPPAPVPSRPQSAGHGLHVNPANIKRVAAELPRGYEVTAVTGLLSPPGSWGLAERWTAHPSRCAELADALRGRQWPTQGVSGSGPGGIVHAVVAMSRTAPVAVDPADIAGCGQWTMATGRATAHVRLIDPPYIGGVATVAMASDITTLAEGGNQIGSRAYTFTAYLGDYWAFTTLVVDPGSPRPALDPRFAAELLMKTVSALRS
jgi:hypothetical protein